MNQDEMDALINIVAAENAHLDREMLDDYVWRVVAPLEGAIHVQLTLSHVPDQRMDTRIHAHVAERGERIAYTAVQVLRRLLAQELAGLIGEGT